MKNFYEATATRSRLTLDCTLTLTPVSEPFCEVLINQQRVYSAEIAEPVTLDFVVGLDETIDLSIHLPQRQHPQAVKVSLTVDGREVLPLYQHAVPTKNCYIDTKNPWIFTVNHFYPWFHSLTAQGWIA